MNAVAIAAGNIRSLEEAVALGYLGYDAVVLGRGSHTHYIYNIYIIYVIYIIYYTNIVYSIHILYNIYML